MAQRGGNGKAAKLCFLAVEAWPGEGKHHGSGRPVQKERETVREQIVQNYQFFYTNLLSNCQISVYLPPITDNPHQSNDHLDDESIYLLFAD